MKYILVSIFTYCVIITKAQDADSMATDTTVYTVAEIMPEFPGGERELFKYLTDSLVYPTHHEQIHFKFFFEFIVEKDGAISNVSLVRPEDYSDSFTESTIRIIENMPLWQPGLFDMTPVRVRMTLPVTFKLD